ncbi:MAG: hypothetical protein VX938_03720 [Myxococcota bacterium]|nr:hypothetical protein [Myxococcota bacterium]
MKSSCPIILTCAALLLIGCGDSSDTKGDANSVGDTSDAALEVAGDTLSPDTSPEPGPDPGSIESAPSCQDYCQGLMDKLFAPGGTQMEDLECLQQNVGTPPAFDLDCLMGAANPSYEGCLECYTGESSGEATCADLVAACL